MSCCSTNRSSFLPLIVIVIALGTVMYVRGRPAPTPPMFAQSVSLETALQQSEETGKPVFVLATADWCGGCQALKRGALMNEKLAAMVRERAIPVYLDATSNSSSGAQAAGRLGVLAYPTLILLKDGQEFDRSGPGSASKLLAWFDKAVPQSQAAKPTTDPATARDGAGEG